MFSSLFIMGGLWIVGSALFVLALVAAGRKPMPAEEADIVVLEHAA
jgi:hypothetical protein